VDESVKLDPSSYLKQFLRELEWYEKQAGLLEGRGRGGSSGAGTVLLAKEGSSSGFGEASPPLAVSA